MKDSTGLFLVLTLALVPDLRPDLRCDTVAPPARLTRIWSIAVSNTGTVAVLGSRDSWERLQIATRSDFSKRGHWKPLKFAQGSIKLLFQGEELLELREDGLYRVRDGKILLTGGHIFDAAAGSNGFVAVAWENEWWQDGVSTGKAGYAIFSEQSKGKFPEIARRSLFDAGTLALYDFERGKGQELYWAETGLAESDNDSRRSSSILRYTRARGVETVFSSKHYPEGNHPILVEETEEGGRLIGWKSTTDRGYHFAREEAGKWREEENHEFSLGAISKNGKWRVGWDSVAENFSRNKK